MTHRDQNHELAAEARALAAKLQALMPAPATEAHRVTFARQTALLALQSAVSWLERDCEDEEREPDPSRTTYGAAAGSSIRVQQSFTCAGCGQTVIEFQVPKDHLCDQCRNIDRYQPALPST